MGEMQRRVHGERKMKVLALAALVLASTAAASGGGETYFTDTDTVTVNPFGSCSLAWNQYNDKSWSFNGPPCGYPSVTCFGKTQGMDDACMKPMPNTNICSRSEVVIATYFDDAFTNSPSSPCPVNFTGNLGWQGEETTSMDCPVTCFDCASMCRWQAASVATKESFYDPTIPKDACNAWGECAARLVISSLALSLHLLTPLFSSFPFSSLLHQPRRMRARREESPRLLLHSEEDPDGQSGDPKGDELWDDLLWEALGSPRESHRQEE